MATTAFASGISIAGIAGIGLLIWLGSAIIADITYRLKPAKAGVAARAARLPAPMIGMWTAHFGMVVFLAGAIGNGLFATEVVVRAMPGDVIDIAGRQMTLRTVEARQGPNYITETAVIELREDGRMLAVLTPEKRFYTAERQTTTEAAIRPRISGDDYAVLATERLKQVTHCAFIANRWSAGFGLVRASWRLAGRLPVLRGHAAAPCQPAPRGRLTMLMILAARPKMMTTLPKRQACNAGPPVRQTAQGIVPDTACRLSGAGRICHSGPDGDFARRTRCLATAIDDDRQSCSRCCAAAP